MSEVLNNPNALQQVEEAYRQMTEAYNRYYHLGKNTDDDPLKLVYKTKLNNYRDICTVVVERLMNTKPEVLEDFHVFYLD